MDTTEPPVFPLPGRTRFTYFTDAQLLAALREDILTHIHGDFLRAPFSGSDLGRWCRWMGPPRLARAVDMLIAAGELTRTVVPAQTGRPRTMYQYTGPDAVRQS